MSDKLETLAAPGNAAVIRKALESIEDDCRVLDRKDMWEEEGECYYDALRDIREKVRDALSAPPEPPSNAAAMREALEWIADFSSDDYIDDEYSVDGENLQRAAERARAALAAPARNADRFATAEEAVAAFADHLRAWENAHGVCSEYPDHPVKVPAGAFAWLFAPAKGGAE